MMKIWLIGPIMMFLLMLGTGCGTSFKAQQPINECVPEIQVKEKLVPIPMSLLQTHENPTVPSHGDNSVLLEWCMICAANNHELNKQMQKLQEINRE